MRFTCAIAGPMPGLVAAACETQLGINYMTYDSFYATPAQVEEAGLAKIAIGDEGTAVYGTGVVANGGLTSRSDVEAPFGTAASPRG